MKKEPYLVEINYPSLTEHIDEKYDSVTTLMTPNAVIYGSALTSLISGIPADGDLDIAISGSEYSKLASNLQGSSKWLQIEGDHVPDPQNAGWRPDWAAPVLRSSKYEEIRDFPLEKTVAFQDVNGVKVQVIKAKQNSTDPLDDALSVVRKVDFAFCGMAMDKYGRLIESIPHAYSDCCAGIIRVANYRAGEKPDRILERINKYVKRGWSLSASIDIILENFRRATLAAPEPADPPEMESMFVMAEIGPQRLIMTTNLKSSHRYNRAWLENKCRMLYMKYEEKLVLQAKESDPGEFYLIPLDLALPRGRILQLINQLNYWYETDSPRMEAKS